MATRNIAKKATAQVIQFEAIPASPAEPSAWASKVVSAIESKHLPHADVASILFAASMAHFSNVANAPVNGYSATVCKAINKTMPIHDVREIAMRAATELLMRAPVPAKT